MRLNICVMKKLFATAFLLLSAMGFLFAQDSSLLRGEDIISRKKEYVTNAFKSSRVINGHSMEFIGKGVLDFRILHRFGELNSGADNLFGLDEASMRLGL